ncbi:MAG: hypothetical protein H0X41_08660 [Chitinophagaceae bacterium]|nr:hypothetical protein [Chitinophagaceae bacterium]
MKINSFLNYASLIVFVIITSVAVIETTGQIYQLPVPVSKKDTTRKAILPASNVIQKYSAATPYNR